MSAPAPPAVESHGIEVRLAGQERSEEWDRFVRLEPGACGYHSWPWVRIVREAAGLEVYPLMALREGEIVGILPLARQRLWPLKAQLLSLPFVNYAGLLCADEEAENALLEAALRLAQERGAARIELRHTSPRASAWGRRVDRVRFVLDLPAKTEDLWRSLPGERRTQVRRAQKNGLVPQTGDADLLQDFYGIISRTWRDHGSPVLPRRFFAAVMGYHPSDTRICVVRSGDRVVAAGFLYRFGERVEVPWVGSLPEFSSSQPGVLLYWTMLQQGCEWGARVFDFGRSPKGSGTAVFKKRWGGVEEQLFWSVWPATSAEGGTSPLATSLVKNLWKRLPVGLATSLGARLSPNIPL